MKRWIYTAVGDDLGLEQRLNKLADQGLELVNAEDGTAFFGQFQPTNRTELRYFVEAAPLLRSEEELRRQVERREAQGWEAVGTINGLDVYRTAPLRFPRVEGERRPSVRPRILLPCLLAAMGACLAWGQGNQTWYLTNLGVFFWATGPVLLPVGSLWALWRIVRLFVPAKKAASEAMVLLRGGLSAAWRLWGLLLLVCLVMTLVPPLWAGMSLALGVLLYLWAMLTRTEEGRITRRRVPFRWKALCVGVTVLLSIAVNRLGISPVVHSFAAGSSDWGRGWMVHAADVMDSSGDITSSEYRKRSSIFVQWESVTESTEHQRLECQRYTCLLPLMCQWFVPQEEDSQTAWALGGNQILILYSSSPWERDPRPLLEGALER